MFLFMILFAVALASTAHSLPPPHSSSSESASSELINARSTTPLGSLEYDDFKIVYETKVDLTQANPMINYRSDDILTYYGQLDENYTSMHSYIIPRGGRCGSNRIMCSTTNNPAPLDACFLLINIMNWSYYRKQIQRGVNHICLKKSGLDTPCCISWGANLWGGVDYGVLVNAAIDTLLGCSPYGDISGRADDVRLGDMCTHQCLTSRPGGC